MSVKKLTIINQSLENSYVANNGGHNRGLEKA